VKTLQHRIREAARVSGLGQQVVERDYAQGCMLLGIANEPLLRDALVFKGGTALRKIHIPGFRFSEDLDFTADGGPMGADLESAVRKVAAAAEASARQYGAVTMTVDRYEERLPHPGGQEAFIVRVQFPWQRRPMVPVMVEITQDEPVLMPSPPRPVLHAYGEPFDVSVCAYGLEEIAAEKLRAIRQTQARLAARGWARSRARDYYNLWHLVRLETGRVDWTLVAGVLPRKCAIRGVTLASVGDAFASALIEEVRATWERTLGPFVAELPDVDRILAETRERLEAVLEL